LGYGVYYLEKNNHKNRNDIYNGGTPVVALIKELLQKMLVYKASKNVITLQILQLVSIIWKPLRDFEGVDPQGIKFSMLSFVLLGCTPF